MIRTENEEVRCRGKGKKLLIVIGKEKIVVRLIMESVAFVVDFKDQVHSMSIVG